MRWAAALVALAWLAAAPLARADIVRTELGSAPIASPAPEPAGPPLLTYLALGLSGVAVVLGGSALAFALDGRRRAEDLADALRERPAPAADPRAADRIARLEAAFDDLAAAAPHRSAPAPVTPPRDPFPAVTLRRSTPPPTPAAPAAPTPSADRLPAWLDELKARFARLALDPPSAAAGFIADLAPRGALAGPEGVALLDGFEGAKLWALRAPGDGEVWALTPGEQAVLNWSAHFAPQRTQVAAEVFGDAFDLEDGGAGLRLEEPALVRRDASGRLSVRRRGRLSGFRA